MQRTYSDFKMHVSQAGRLKGETGAKRAGQTYCEAWRDEIDLAKRTLLAKKNSISPLDYNRQVVELNKQTQELSACINEHNKQFQ